MHLFISSTPRSLENKLKLFGFELLDLLLIFIYLSLSNLLFGQTILKVPFVWIGTLVMGLVIYFFKKNKPAHYLGDLLQSIMSPSVFSANFTDTAYQPYFKKEFL